MYESYEDDPQMVNQQNHGAVTGDEEAADTVEDVQLQRAVEILAEDPLFDNLIAKYHKDTSETQVEATDDESGDAPSAKPDDAKQE